MEPLQPIRAKSVRSFGLVWLITVIGAAVVFSIVSVLCINYYTTEDPAWIDLLYRQKHVAMQRRESAPHRIVIVGGSGALFGIDAELIEKKLHIPTVNFATHAGLGLRYLLDRVRGELRAGDIVLLSAEYETWSDTYRDTQGPAFDYIWTYDKPYLAKLNPVESAKMISAVPWSQWPRSVRGWIDRIHGDYFHFRKLAFYSVATLDLNGDINVTTPCANSQLPSFPFPSDSGLAAMKSVRDFGDYAQSHGIKLLWTWPNFARPAAVSGPPGFLTDVLQQSGFVILDRPVDTAFPPDWFMDTPYHPNPACRRLRTEELIRRLRPALGLPPDSNQVLGVFLLAGTDHMLTDDNIFADKRGILFRYLSRESNFYAITPERVVEFVNGGMPLYTDSEEARPLLESVGLTLEAQFRRTQTVQQWFAKYPQAVFCIAVAQNQPLDPIWKSVIPDIVFQQLSSGSATAAIFGSGVTPILATEIKDRLLQSDSIPCVVSLQTSPIGKITVDEREFLSSSAGVCVVAIDPEMGIVLDKAIFGGGPDIETWRLYRVVWQPTSHRAL
jgi:hypothetical protein